jgi:carboxyl-terminal processing protease
MIYLQHDVHKIEIRFIKRKRVKMFFRALVVLFLFHIGFLFGAPRALKMSDVRPTMQEIFEYHVEWKDLSPLIVKRSFKIYLEQFDRERIYLLQDEVKPFLELNQDFIGAVIKRFRKDDFSDYQALNKIVVNAIRRGRELRTQIAKEMVANGPQDAGKSSETYLYYAKNEEELKARMRKMYGRFLEEDKFLGGPALPTSERREKVFALYEKRLQRQENPYISKEKREHYQALLILKAYAKSLDAHTAYFSPEEAYEMRTSLEKQFDGIGVVLRESVDGVVIVGMVKGGPAERSGKVQSGDILVEINRQKLDQITYEEVLTLLQGKGQKEIILKLRRIVAEGKEENVQVSLVREKIVMQDDRLQCTAEPFGNGIIGKLTLPSFYESEGDSSCEKDIREALRQLRQQGKLHGVVLDLRENLGGFLNQAVKVAGLFMTSGVVVISKYADGEVQYLRDIDARVYYNGPLVILTSKASASAAEIVAQALQDYGIAVVAGDERTYGKGTIQMQTVTDLNAKAFFKVTVGKYYTVSGRSTQIEGVQADILVPTEYCIYNIGERYLEYPLPNDRVPPAYTDPLADIDAVSRRWYQKNYLPYLQKKESFWYQILPILRENSVVRQENDPNFKLFLQAARSSSKNSPHNWGVEDLQMIEAVNIIKDMIIQKQH